MTEGGGFTAICTLSHFLETSFLAIIPIPVSLSQGHGILPHIPAFLKPG